MADERKIVIEIKNTDSTGTVETSKDIIDDNGGKEVAKVINSLMHPLKTVEKETIGRNVLANQAFQYAKETIKNVGQYHIYKYFTLKENYLAETDYNNIMTGISKVSGFGASIAAGAMVGAKFGPVGAVAGAAIGVAGWGINESINVEKNLFQQQVQISTNNYQSQFQQTRLGLVSGRGVTNQ